MKSMNDLTSYRYDHLCPVQVLLEAIPLLPFLSQHLSVRSKLY
jgi:hypothetical protein